RMIALLIVVLLPGIAAWAASAPTQRGAIPCKGCHLGHEKDFIDPQSGVARVPKVEPQRRHAAMHAEVTCQQCPVSGYRTFPHRDIETRGCMACHPRRDAAGARVDAAYDFQAISREFDHSIHTTATRDKLGDNVDARYGIRFHVIGSGEGFRCSMCHHPHYMQDDAQLRTPAAIIGTHNRWCTRCHATDPDRPLNIMLGVDWQAIADPAPAGLAAEHASIPFAVRHLASARCVDCHAGSAHEHSHEILPGAEVAGCQSCHARDSALAPVYRRGDEPPARGFTNNALLQAGYV